MRKIILTVFFLSAGIFAIANNTKESNETCESYAFRAAQAEITYYGGHHNWYNVYTGWVNDCYEFMDGDPSGWSDPLFCDLSCWPGYYD